MARRPAGRRAAGRRLPQLGDGRRHGGRRRGGARPGAAKSGSARTWSSACSAGRCRCCWSRVVPHGADRRRRARGDRAQRPAGQPRPGHHPAAGGPGPGAVAGVRRPGVRARRERWRSGRSSRRCWCTCSAARLSLGLVGALVAAVALLCLPPMRRLDARLGAPRGPAAGRSRSTCSRRWAWPPRSRWPTPCGRSRWPAGDVVIREGDDADGLLRHRVRAGRGHAGRPGAAARGPGRVLRRDRPAARRAADRDGDRGRGHRAAARSTGTRSSGAVSGHRDARRAAEDIASRRLAV